MMNEVGSRPDIVDNCLISSYIKWAEKAGMVTSQTHFVDVYGLDPEVSDEPIPDILRFI